MRPYRTRVTLGIMLGSVGSTSARGQGCRSTSSATQVVESLQALVVAACLLQQGLDLVAKPGCGVGWHGHLRPDQRVHTQRPGPEGSWGPALAVV